MSKLKEYISEWFLDVSSTIELGKYDSFERIYNLYDVSSSELIFKQTLKVSDIDVEKSLASTSGIINDELRGLVEQCIALDKQMEELNGNNSKTESQQKYK